jgi:hypothetical protein
MGAAEARCEIVKWSRRGSQKGWSERNGSILTTFELVAIMPPGDLAA